MTAISSSPTRRSLIVGSAATGAVSLLPMHSFAARLAQSTQKRSPSLLEVPTYQEAGIKELVLDQWVGVFVPAGTPPEIVTHLNIEINKALGEAAIRDASVLATPRLGKTMSPSPTSPARQYRRSLPTEMRSVTRDDPSPPACGSVAGHIEKPRVRGAFP